MTSGQTQAFVLPQIVGQPSFSAWVATGLTVSGVEEVMSRSTLSVRIAWLAS